MSTALPTITHWIDGKSHAGRSARTAPVHDPALGEPQAYVELAGPDEIEAAVAAASAAFPQWRDLSLSRR